MEFVLKETDKGVTIDGQYGDVIATFAGAHGDVYMNLAFRCFVVGMIGTLKSLWQENKGTYIVYQGELMTSDNALAHSVSLLKQ